MPSCAAKITLVKIISQMPLRCSAGSCARLSESSANSPAAMTMPAPTTTCSVSTSSNTQMPMALTKTICR